MQNLGYRKKRCQYTDRKETKRGKTEYEPRKVRNCGCMEHYRKLEAGITGISVDKVLTLYHKYGIDPTYLITGESSMKDFNLDYYVANSTKEQRNEFFDRVLAYLSKLIR